MKPSIHLKVSQTRSSKLWKSQRLDILTLFLCLGFILFINYSYSCHKQTCFVNEAVCGYLMTFACFRVQLVLNMNRIHRFLSYVEHSYSSCFDCSCFRFVLCFLLCYPFRCTLTRFQFTHVISIIFSVKLALIRKTGTEI